MEISPFNVLMVFATPFNISLSGALTGPGGAEQIRRRHTQVERRQTIMPAAQLSATARLQIAPSSLPTNGAVTLNGTAGSPINSVLPTAAGQYWTINGNMTYTAGTIAGRL